MSNKRIVDFLQNLILLALTALAVYLLTCFPMIDGTVTGKVQKFLIGPDSEVRQMADIADIVSEVHLMVTNQYEYGRYACLNVATDGADFQRMAPLFREAIGSAAAGEVVSDEVFRAALEQPGIYVDLRTALPVAVVSAWLGENGGDTDYRKVRAIGLVAEKKMAALYFLNDGGEARRCVSALTSNAVRELVASFAPNDGRFAFESGDDALTPYTILVRDNPTAAVLQASLPAEYTSYNLLTALEFNAHTTSRYYESSGVEVVMQSPVTLRIGVDGSVNSSTDGEFPGGLYRLACAGAVPTVREALQSAYTIARVLREGTHAAELTLDTVERTARGWIITFYYHVNGVRVYLREDKDALRVEISGDTVVSFDFVCRSYTPQEQNSELLPPDMAVAIASMHKGTELVLAYVDNGADTIDAQWLAR